MRFFIFFLSFLSIFPLFGQTEFRGAVQVGLNLPYKFKIDASLEDRYTNKGFKQIQTDWEIRKTLIKGLGIGTTYRFEGEPAQNSSNFLSYNHRLGVKLKIDFFNLLDRSKRVDLGISFNQQWNWKEEGKNLSVLRGKLFWGYDIKNFPITPKLYVEHFYCWNENITFTQTETIIEPGNRTFRYMGGFEYEFNKHTQLVFILGRDYIFRKNRFENIVALTFKHDLH